jgi:hypothetical protein
MMRRYVSSWRGVCDCDLDRVIFRDGVWALPLHDGSDTMVEVEYCPWCGARLDDFVPDDELDRGDRLYMEEPCRRLISEALMS